jgi:membrane protease YdiL (CAAX protease family)
MPLVIYYGLTGNENGLAEFIDSGNAGNTFSIYLGIQLAMLGLVGLLMKIFKLSWDDFGFVKKRIEDIWMVLPAFVAYFALTLLLGGIAAAFLSEEVINQEQDTGFGDASALWEMALAFVALVIIAPVAEELLFRGFLFRRLRRDWPFFVSALVTAALFGLAHFQINVAIDTFALALPLAYLMEKTGNVFIPIALHSLKNLIAFMLLFVLDIEAFEGVIDLIF